MDEASLRATMRRRRRLGRLAASTMAILGAVAAIGLAWLGARHADERSRVRARTVAEAPGPDPHAGFSPGARRRRMAVFAGAGDDSAFTRKPSPKPGDWLHHFREPGQTVAEHARDCQNRRTAARHTLHLQPYADLGPDRDALLAEIAAFSAVYFAVDAQVLPAVSPPSAAWSAHRGQWDAERVADAQERAVPAESLGVLGLMGGDLFAGDLNFVFGIGRFARRVGVHSLARFGTAPARLRRRAFALAAHELGHMFGIEHCVFYACVMNGANSLAEADRGPLHLCPVCREKLRHAIGFEHGQRYRRLTAFYDERGLSAAAAFTRAQVHAFTR